MNETAIPTLFTSWEPDPLGVLLGTGFNRFNTRVGIDGLAKITGSKLEILAVHAKTKGVGQFRDFITFAKRQFSHIYVWQDDNPIVTNALQRYDFTPAYTIEAGGEVVAGWEWIAP